jgi:hypothetical protein
VSADRRIRLAASLGYLAARVCTRPGVDEAHPGIPALSDEGVSALAVVVAELADTFGAPERGRR